MRRSPLGSGLKDEESTEEGSQGQGRREEDLGFLQGQWDRTWEGWWEERSRGSQGPTKDIINCHGSWEFILRTLGRCWEVLGRVPWPDPISVLQRFL